MRMPEVEITIRVSEESLAWAIRHINDWLAAQPVNTEPLGHEFVTALSHPVRTSDSQR